MEKPSPNSPQRKLIVTPDEAAAEGVKLDLNLITTKEVSKSGIIYVVMDKDCTTVMMAAGQTKPFHTKSKKYAEQVARQAGGVAVPYREALELVASSPCNLPKDSKRYSPDKRAPKIKLSGGRG